ncbi:BCCT family transporter [Bounagaea algeriensis]
MTDLPTRRRGRTDVPVLMISGGLLAAFVVAALVAPTGTADAVTATFELAARAFGGLWQILLLATFVIAIALACSRRGNVLLGATKRPEYGRFQWVSMIMCTLLAGGGVFFAAGEPLQHFISLPPYYDGTRPGSQEAVNAALAQSFSHWGFLAWAILGSLGAIVMMRGVQRGMPLRPRTLLHPVLGTSVAHSWIGKLVDIICIVAVVAGTVGPIGFLGLQASYGLSQVFGTPDTYPVQVGIIAVLTVVAVLSVISGIGRGIPFLSRMNVWGALVLMAAFIALGSAGFLMDSFLGGFAQYVQDFVPLSLYRGDEEWLGSWTVFFFGWFLGYGPLMSIFVARISHGRTLRDLVVNTSVVAPIAATIWFTVLGGTGIFFEQRNPGVLAEPLDASGVPAAVFTITDQLPLGPLLGVGVLLLTLTFVATTTDSMSYSIASAGTTDGEPATAVRAFWAVLMGVAAAALILIGDGGINALQQFIVVTAVPVGFIMLPTLWTAPRVAKDMALEQGILTSRTQVPTTPDDSGADGQDSAHRSADADAEQPHAHAASTRTAGSGS